MFAAPPRAAVKADAVLKSAPGGPEARASCEAHVSFMSGGSAVLHGSFGFFSGPAFLDQRLDVGGAHSQRMPSSSTALSTLASPTSNSANTASIVSPEATASSASYQAVPA